MIFKIHVIAETPNHKRYLIYDGCSKHPINQLWDLYEEDGEKWFKTVKAFLLDSKKWTTVSNLTCQLISNFGGCRDSTDFQDQTKYFRVLVDEEIETTPSLYLQHGPLSHNRDLLPLKVQKVEEVDQLEYSMGDIENFDPSHYTSFEY